MNTNQHSATNKAKVTTSKDIDDRIIMIMDDYDTLTLNNWMNHDELYIAFNAALTIPTPGRVVNKDLAFITLV